MNKSFMNIQNSIPPILSRAFGTKFFLFLSLLGATLCFTSCDESSVVGLDIQPANDLLNVGYQDTTTLLTTTIREDSLRTDALLVTDGVGLIGKYVDPIFGTSTASMYTQLRLPSNITTSSNFGNNPVCDSIVLSLVYEGSSYGKKDAKVQTINVYEVTEDIVKTSYYYSNNSLSKNPIDLTQGHAGFNFTPRPTDSVSNILGPTVEPKQKPQIRVRMDNTFGQLLLNNQSSGNLADDVSFKSFLKGLYITTENTTGLSVNEGNIMRFYMGSSNLILYYHHDSPAPNTGLSYTFSLGSVARFNTFTHDYSSSVDVMLADQLGASPASQNATTFIQSMSGVKTKVLFPHLMHWADNGAIGINKAELVILADTSLSPVFNCDTFPPPPTLIIYGIEDDGVTPFLIPDAFEGTSYFGGSINYTKYQYTFNIARYIQQILDGKRKNNGIYILASNGAGYANRVIIGGGSASSAKQMKLNITYTKLH